MNKDKMMGRKTALVGGTACRCCQDAPRHRKTNRRAMRRRERQEFKRNLSTM